MMFYCLSILKRESVLPLLSSLVLYIHEFLARDYKSSAAKVQERRDALLMVRLLIRTQQLINPDVLLFVQAMSWSGVRDVTG